MSDRYTRNETVRILGVDECRLRYWERLRLVRPRARWGQRFYSFSDLVALEAIKRLTGRKIPAQRLRRVVAALEQELGAARLPLEKLRLVDNGRRVAVVPAGSPGQAFDPLRKQWLLPFEARRASQKLHQMVSRTAEEWFEIGLSCESVPEMLPQAIEAYQTVLHLAPDWIEAHLNLGVAYYRLDRWEEARNAFRAAVALDPTSSMARYNLGCVLEELDEIDEAVEHLRRAVRGMPAHADAHFNLALAYEKRGETRRARQHWALYLRYDPHGAWADIAHSRLAAQHPGQSRPEPIPFPDHKS